MKLARFILVMTMSGCWGCATVSLFENQIGMGLGVFVIGCWLAVFYLVLWIVDIS